MVDAEELQKQVDLAMEEIGEIKPVFRKRFKMWAFLHKNYPDVEYFGNSSEEVLQNYPRYLREFIKQRLDQNIWTSVDQNTKGRGGGRKQGRHDR